MTSISERVWTSGGKTKRAFKVDYKDAFGARKRSQFDTKREATRFVESLGALKEQAKPGGPKVTPTRFREVGEHFLQSIEIGRDGNPPLERSTITQYRSILENNIYPIIGDRMISGLERQDAESVRDRLLGSGITRQSAIKRLFVLSTVLGHARDRRLISSNPAEGVRIARDLRREAVLQQTLAIHTKEEMGAIIEAAAELRRTTGRQAFLRGIWTRFEPMLHTLVFAGLRMSELRGLPRGALDSRNMTLLITQRADVYGTIGPPKSRHGVRRVHIPSDLVRRLEEWLSGAASDKRALMFPTKTGSPIDHTNLADRMWARAQEKAGVRKLNPHSARHFFASSLIDKGVQAMQLREMLGHHDPAFTLRTYGHLFHDEESIAALKAKIESISAGVLEDED